MVQYHSIIATSPQAFSRGFHVSPPRIPHLLFSLGSLTPVSINRSIPPPSHTQVSKPMPILPEAPRILTLIIGQFVWNSCLKMEAADSYNLRHAQSHKTNHQIIIHLNYKLSRMLLNRLSSYEGSMSAVKTL